jgi:hypothetical protein
MCKFCEGDRRKAEIDALLDGGEDSHSQIAAIVGAKKWEIRRYASHREKKIASPGQPESLLNRLYANLEKQADKMLRKGGDVNTRHAVTLLGKLTSLRKQLEAAEANEPKAEPRFASPVEAVRAALGFAPADEPRRRTVNFENEGGTLRQVLSLQDAELAKCLERFAQEEAELRDPRKDLILFAGYLHSGLRGVELEPGLREIVNEFVKRLDEWEESDETEKMAGTGIEDGRGDKERGNKTQS